MGSTDAGRGHGHGKAWFKVPETIKFVIDGELAPGVTGKDVILHIIGMIGVDGALYKAMEFSGSAIESMPMDERLSISNMAIEAGGKAGLIPVDDVTRAYLDERAERPYTAYYSDDDAQFAQVVEIDAADIVPTVAFPAPAEQHAPGGRGSRREDRPGRHRQLHQRAPRRHAPGRSRARGPHGASGRALHRHPRHSEGVPAVHRRGAHGHLHRRPLRRVHPTCGPCLAATWASSLPESAPSPPPTATSSGRMGDPTSEVYLSSPAVAAASAVLGHIGLPEDLEAVADAAE